MRLKPLLAAGLCAALFHAGPAFAAEDSVAAAKALLRAMRYDEIIAQTMQQMEASMQQQMEQQLWQNLPNCAETPDCKSKVGAFLQQVMKTQQAYFHSPETRKLMNEVQVQALSKNFSVAEIREMSAFYQTPTGSKMLRLMPKITAEIGPVLMKDIGQRLMPELKQQMDEFARRNDVR
ncbi:DUF2059 domain-containing protein [Chromobacterium sp. S0633]|uniref:DUF2059 domain-containing protein n=1 Tax=unclassified Chromobacterium TaxID=2641838 RepID=UPI000D32230E|nr:MULTISPECIES: DUF2059 domain-containing protein [unclassified Chromobacterium]MCP1291206.1 DUF2059 domain-containing protein [Chromobacterium sp. S0633]PTU67385.1 hypothetical protein DB032_21880 [Chromobacterium sp. Panama]